MATRSQSRPNAFPTYHEEKVLLNEGYSLIAGLDEVGRGPLAGPVVAGLAILPHNPKGRWLRLIRDSKQLSSAARENALAHLQDAGTILRTGICSSEEVDAIGIAPATRLAMCRALDDLLDAPQYLLLDAFPLPDVPIPQKPIIKGDEKCLSIAAASIVAKVTRDSIMAQEEVSHPGYGFSRHKGYGTREHLQNIERLGPCPIHRFTFAPIKTLYSRAT
jgi:ribonuclease HII